MRIKDFVNTALRDYARYDNERNLPGLLDGLKITERKILFAFMEDMGSGKFVVERAAGRAATRTHYQHGATSMEGVMVKMAQTFPGTNNLNLLDPLGQFGSILDPESSATRYISTRLNDNFKKLFDSDDKDILTYDYSEGERIEPETYLPKLPLLLINGSKGQGNGFATNILQYNPEDVKKAVQDTLKHGAPKEKLIPWFRGYKGKVYKDVDTKQVTIYGVMEKKNSTTLVIKELPPGSNWESYKLHLNKLIDSKFIKGFDNESTDAGWNIIIDAPRTTTELDAMTLFEKFKLMSRDTETIVVWHPQNRPRQYKTIEDLIVDWVKIRLDFYEKRRLQLVRNLNDELIWLEAKIKFIKWWNQNAGTLVDLPYDDLLYEVENHVIDVPEIVERLLAIRVSNLTLDQVLKLESDIAKQSAEMDRIAGLSNKDMMTDELKGIKL